MKKCIVAIVAAFAAVAASRAAIDANELAELALKDAVADATSSLAAAAKIPAKEPVAVLPFADGGAGVVGLLKNALVSAGKTCVDPNTSYMKDAPQSANSLCSQTVSITS